MWRGQLDHLEMKIITEHLQDGECSSTVLNCPIILFCPPHAVNIQQFLAFARLIDNGTVYTVPYRRKIAITFVDLFAFGVGICRDECDINNGTLSHCSDYNLTRRIYPTLQRPELEAMTLVS